MVKLSLPEVDKQELIEAFRKVFMPLTVLFLVVLLVIHFLEKRTDRLHLEAGSENIVQVQRRLIENEIQRIASDLFVLAGHHAVAGAMSEGAQDMDDLAQELLVFARNKPAYDQIHLVDEKGWEVLRIDRHDGRPARAPAEKLENKAKRRYFEEAYALEKGVLYISPFDLNVVGGEIERPYKPVIRFATPVFDSQGRKRGIVAVNYLGNKLFARLTRETQNFAGEAMILNRHGYWLHPSSEEGAWGFLISGAEEKTFGMAYEEEWNAINETETGHIHTGNGLFAFTAVYPLRVAAARDAGPLSAVTSEETGAGPKAYNWKIVARIPPNLLAAGKYSHTGFFLLLFIGLEGILASCCWLLAHARFARRLGREELRTQEDFYENLIQSASEMIISSNMDRKITRFNKAAEESFGYTEEELIGEDVNMLYEDDSVSTGINKSIMDNNSFTGEISNRRKNGTTFPAILRASILLEKDGKPTGVMGLSRDITHQKRIEAEKHRLEESKEEFIAMVSHDLKRTITSILGFAHLLASRLKQDAVVSADDRAFIHKIRNHSDRMKRIMSDFLDFSALEGGHVKLRLELRNLNESVRKVADQLAEYAAEKHARIILDLNDDLPFVQIDETRIQQVIENFINNAVKFGPPGCRIVARTLFEGNAAVLEVEDSGPGFSQEDMSKAFEKYTRLSNLPTGEEKSTGLGLAICRGLVEAHGGRIGVRNNPRDGATFWFRLQVKSDEFVEI